jgi:hypothetical protein
MDFDIKIFCKNNNNKKGNETKNILIKFEENYTNNLIKSSYKFNYYEPFKINNKLIEGFKIDILNNDYLNTGTFINIYYYYNNEKHGINLIFRTIFSLVDKKNILFEYNYNENFYTLNLNNGNFNDDNSFIEKDIEGSVYLKYLNIYKLFEISNYNKGIRNGKYLVYYNNFVTIIPEYEYYYKNDIINKWII